MPQFDSDLADALRERPDDDRVMKSLRQTLDIVTAQRIDVRAVRAGLQVEFNVSAASYREFLLQPGLPDGYGDAREKHQVGGWIYRADVVAAVDLLAQHFADFQYRLVEAIKATDAGKPLPDSGYAVMQELKRLREKAAA